MHYTAESTGQLCLMITEVHIECSGTFVSVTSGKLSLVMGGDSDSARSVSKTTLPRPETSALKLQ